VKGPPNGASGEEVRPLALELACARPAEDETEAPLLDEAVHLVQEVGQALNLVDHHGAPGGNGPQLVGEERDTGEVRLVARLIEQVDPVGRG